VALNCGTVLREAFKHEQLAKIVLYSPVFWAFFDYVETGVFDVAGDAFSTFKVPKSEDVLTQELLIRHKQLTADFLSENYPAVSLVYTLLTLVLQEIRSAIALTELRHETTICKGTPPRHVSDKLLSEILLARENLPVMRLWIESIDNLMLMMNLLRDRSRNIQFEAFHVFKVPPPQNSQTPTNRSCLWRTHAKVNRWNTS
jgi:calcium binding protein 39